jgi:hypothetical protein
VAKEPIENEDVAKKRRRIRCANSGSMIMNRSRGNGADPGGNPGKAGPKGALGLPGARNKKRGRQQDKNEQRNFVTLSKAARKQSRRDGTN